MRMLINDRFVPPPSLLFSHLFSAVVLLPRASGRCWLFLVLVLALVLGTTDQQPVLPARDDGGGP